MSELIENIGNVTLDYTYYPGEDYYSEGEAEDLLLDIVKKNQPNDFDRIIQQYCSWSVLYHLSHVRENVISWLPISPSDKVLEVGAGCGAITGDLSRRAGSVTCIELSKKRSLINAYRHADCDNINIMVGNFETVEPNLTEKYDVITLIGVLEYATSYISAGEDKHQSMIECLKKHLAPGGRIVVAIENRMGLKYFAGCKEDHTGKYFGGIEGYKPEDGVKTFSKMQLEVLFSECGMKTKFYYPYPDYKLPHTIYSDDKLPNVGDLTTNLRNLDNDRIILFDESKAFDSIISEGVFPTYSNSFVVVATTDKAYDEWDSIPIYAKYSDERMEQLRISTQIFKNQDGSKSVYKEALTTKANNHIRQIARNYDLLNELFNDKKIFPNKCELIPGTEPRELIAGMTSKARDKVKLEFLSGLTLEDYIEDLERKGEFEEITSLLNQYVDFLKSAPGIVKFYPDRDFEKLFGWQTYKKEYFGTKISNYDLIFSNIIIDENQKLDGVLSILDYEWVYDFVIPIPFLIYRALYYQFESKASSDYISYLNKKGLDLYGMYGIDVGERLLFAEMESTFQRNLINGVASIEVMQVLMPSATISLDRVINASSYLRGLSTPKIYYSRGMIFSPEQRINLIAKDENGDVSMRIPIDHYLTSVRIDPTEYPCVIYIKSVRLVMQDGSKPSASSLLVNGYLIGDRMVLFDTDDAQIIVENITTDVKAIEVDYKVTMYEQIFYNETVRQCKLAEEMLNKENAKLKHKIMRKLHIEKRPDTPAGYNRVNLIDK